MGIVKPRQQMRGYIPFGRDWRRYIDILVPPIRIPCEILPNHNEDGSNHDSRNRHKRRRSWQVSTELHRVADRFNPIDVAITDA